MAELARQNTLVMIGDSALCSKRLEAAIINSRCAGFSVALYAGALSTARMSIYKPAYQGLSDVDLSDFDVLIIPDGLGNPSRRDYDQLAVDTVRHFLVASKDIVLFDCCVLQCTEHPSDSKVYG